MLGPISLFGVFQWMSFVFLFDTFLMIHVVLFLWERILDLPFLLHAILEAALTHLRRQFGSCLGLLSIAG
jgi:hypothetical protein